MTRNPQPIQVIDRMSQLLDAVAAYKQPVSLKFLCADTGLHPSTAYRILGSMAAHGFVERSEAGDYRLGRRLAELGHRVSARLDVRAEAKKIMEGLRDEFGESINLTVREGDQVVYVERAIPNRMMRVEQVVGSRAPLHVTAVGKMMLASGGEQAAEGYAERTGLPGLTKNTLTDLPQLKAELKRIQKQGYALDNEEAEIGVGCIGALVYNAEGEAVAGLSVSAPIERRRDEWIPGLRNAAMELSARLGFRHTP